MRGIRGRTALACALVVVLAAAACSSSGHHPASSTSRPGASPPHTASGSSGPAPGTLPDMTWTRTSAPALALGGGASSTIAALVAPGAAAQPWLAAGTQTAANGTTTATVWTGPDGLHWSASPLPGAGPSQARAASAWSGGEVVVGATGSGSGERAAAWVSTGPGRPFQRVTDVSAFGASPAPNDSGPAAGGPGGGPGAVMDHVAAGALGIFASGTVGGRTALWYSTNGTRWSRLTSAEKVIDTSDDAVINSLVVAQNGVWAAGSVASGSQSDAAVWTSSDGIHWKAVMSAQRSFHGDGDHVINSLMSLGTGFVAVGAVRTSSVWMPASWISPDGASWSQPSQSFPMAVRPTGGDAGAQVEAVAAEMGQPLMAVGGSATSPRVWTSTDGLSWTEVPLPATAAAASGWRLDLVASSATTTVVADDTVGVPRLLTHTAGSWTEVTANPAAFGSPAVEVQPSALLVDGSRAYLAVNERFPGQALGTSTWSAAVLSTSDGSSWKVDVNGGPFADHEISSLLSVQSGLVAVGATAGTSAASTTMWSSADGASWAVTYTGPSGERASNVIRLGSSLVAVGEGPGGPAAAPTGPGSQAVAWVGTGNGAWQAAGSLDAAAGLGTQRPAGACAGPQTVAAVGTGTTGSPGRQALAWTSSDGKTWKAATISPGPAAGEEEGMYGCLTTGSGFLAYGGSGGAGADVDPALWSASSGSSWTRQGVRAFAGSDAGAITALALRGTNWVAVSGAPPLPDPAAGAPTAASAASTVGLWRSADAGTTWQQVPAAGAPWTGQLDASAGETAWLGSTALVAGTVDGRLMVWTGTTA